MATIEKTYEVEPYHHHTFFLFESFGRKGIILKFVWLQEEGSNQFNLAFGDYEDGLLNDEVVTNNNDVAQVISTVVKCVHEFVETHPGVEIFVRPLERKRASLYNYIFRNRILEFEQRFEVSGVVANEREKYDPAKLYDSFVLKHRN